MYHGWCTLGPCTACALQPHLCALYPMYRFSWLQTPGLHKYAKTHTSQHVTGLPVRFQWDETRDSTPLRHLMCVHPQGGGSRALHIRPGKVHRDTIFSAHMTIQLVASGQVYSVPQPEPKHQLLQSPCGLSPKQSPKAAADPQCATTGGHFL